MDIIEILNNLSLESNIKLEEIARNRFIYGSSNSII